MRAARFDGLRAATPGASASARGASRKSGTRCEVALRRELWRRGLRYRVDVSSLPGRPDLIFARARVAVFCDGDFWHGRDLDARVAKLAVGHNAPYWVRKIRGNVTRDRKHDEVLAARGWTVLRFWETDILRDAAGVAVVVEETVRRFTRRDAPARRHPCPRPDARDGSR